jgi:hypothetical protein
MQAGMSLLIAALALCALPGVAQDHGSHAASVSGSHATAAASQHTAGSFSVRGHIAINPNQRGMSFGGYSRPRGPRQYNGYGSGWGTPTLLPYDTEYDQPEGRGTFNQGAAEQPQDEGQGPTIFEHNGHPSETATYAVSANRDFQQAQHDSDSAPAVQTVLIFRDGHQQEVANYAIAGDRLIVMGEKTEKIQLSDLDLGATSKANHDRGIDFKTPTKG